MPDGYMRSIATWFARRLPWRVGLSGEGVAGEDDVSDLARLSLTG